MKNSEQKSKSKVVSLLLLIPALLLAIISAAMAYIGLGLITLLPAVIGFALAFISIRMFRESFRIFAYSVAIICLLSSMVSVFRGVVLGSKVATDNEFDSTLVKTQKDVDKDIQDAFGTSSNDSIH